MFLLFILKYLKDKISRCKLPVINDEDFYTSEYIKLTKINNRYFE